MIQEDTVRLLRECSSGITMGIDSIGEVMTSVKDGKLRDVLCDSREKHRELGLETDMLLDNYGDNEKEPAMIAKGMSKLKSEIKLTMAGDEKDSAVADLITDGCNMGIKSLSKYLNEYEAADEKSKDITKRLIAVEEALCRDVRQWL
ncbi:MAG: hypothetical protein IIX84_07875 [Oscillospiraceae bacterium]|nr:hypothetical protein [Oscillospiraceae bacterium]